MKKRKPSRDMTPEERLRDDMRHFPTLLNRWAGGTAKVVELTTSHATLIIGILHPQKHGSLELHLQPPPRYFRGP